MTSDFNFVLDYANDVQPGINFNDLNSESSGDYWTSAQAIVTGGNGSPSSDFSDWKPVMADEWPEQLGFSGMVNMSDSLFGNPDVAVPAPTVKGTTLSPPLNEEYFTNKLGEDQGSKAYNQYMSRYDTLQDYANNLSEYLSANPSIQSGLSSEDEQNMIAAAADTIFGISVVNNSMVANLPDNVQMLNTLIMSKVFADIGSDPSSYGVTSSQFQNFMTGLTTGAPIMPGEEEKTLNPYYEGFLSAIQNYVQTSTPENTLDGIIGTFFNDTVGPALNEDTDQMNIVDPSYAHIPPINDSVIDKTFDINLDSPANQALYTSILDAYAAANNLTPAEVQAVLAEHNDPTIDNPAAQKINLIVMAGVLASLAKDGELTITQAQFNSVVPPQLASEVSSILAEAGTSTVGGLTAAQLTAVLGALFVAGQAEVDEASNITAKVDDVTNAAMLNGVIFLAATTAMKTVINPLGANLESFLAIVGKYTLEFRNEMLEVMISTATVSQTLNVAKQSTIEAQMQVIQQSIANQAALAAEEQAALAQLKSEGIGYMGGGGAMVAAGAGIIALGAWLIAQGVALQALPIIGTIIGAILIAIGTAIVVAGTALASAGASLMITGGMTYAEGEGINIAQAIQNAFPSSQDKIAMAVIMAIIMVLMLIITIATGGATEGVEGALITASIAVLAGTASSVAGMVLGDLITPLIQQDLQNAQVSSSQANNDTTAIVIAINIALTIIGVLAGNYAKAVVGIMSGATKAAEEGAQVVEEVAEEAAEEGTTNGMSAVQQALQSVKNFAKAMGSAMGEALGDFAEGALNGIKALGKSSTYSLGNMALSPKVLLYMFMALVQSASTIASAVTSYFQAQSLQKQAAFEAIQATIDEDLVLLNAQIKMLDMETQGLQQDSSNLEAQITQFSEIFQNLVQNLMQAVTAITSNQASPDAAATGGGGSQQVKDAKAGKVDPKEVLLSGMINAASMAMSGSAVEEGYEARTAGTAKPKNKAAMSNMVRRLSSKITKSLIDAGMDPKEAEKEGMKQAANTLKQLSMLSDEQMDMSKEGQEALTPQAVLTTIALLLAQKGIPMNAAELVQANISSGVIDETTLNKLLKTLEEQGKTNPLLLQMAGKLKKLMNQKGSMSSAEFNFKVLELFSNNLSGGTSDLNPFQFLFGGGESEGDSDYIDKDLINEYFIQGSSSNGALSKA